MNAEGTDVRTMIIGYGNPLRGDDGVGWVAIQQLSEKLDPAAVALHTAHLLTPELADPISKMDLVIFIDAAENEPPGVIHEVPVEPEVATTASMTHHFTAGRLLALAEQLFGRHPRARLFTIGGVDFGHKEGLTEPVARACRKLVDLVHQIISNRLPEKA